MPGTFDRLHWSVHTEIVVLNAPLFFEGELTRLKGVRVSRDLLTARHITFALIFVTRKAQLDQLAKAITSKIQDDATLWFAYPKVTSRNLTCDFDRDTGWDVIRRAGFDFIRHVAIDEDWSALRFRRSEFIKRQSS
jgi:hypothetical protein